MVVPAWLNAMPGIGIRKWRPTTRQESAGSATVTDRLSTSPLPHALWAIRSSLLRLTTDLVKLARNQLRSTRRRLEGSLRRFGILRGSEHNHAHPIAFTVVQPSTVLEPCLRLCQGNHNFLQHALSVIRTSVLRKLHLHHYCVSHFDPPVAGHIKWQAPDPTG